MKKGIFSKVLLVFSVLSVVFLVSCADGEKVTTDSVFEGGSQGLMIEFEPFGVEETGVSTIFDTETFPISIVLRNKGEEDVAVGNAKVSLKGINLGDFDGIASGSLANDDVIEGVSDTDPNGGEEVIEFTTNAGAKYKPKVTGFYQPDIFAVVEYKYKTHLIIPEVCFKEDLTDKSICEVQETKESFVSGAPVTVTKVEEDVAGKGVVVLLITVQNVGGGRVTLPDAEFEARFDHLAFKVVTEPEKWECRSTGRENEARLTSGSAVIICKLREALAEDTLFTKQIDIDLEYKYQSVAQQTIKIVESEE